jgi:hypothetical protein
MEIGIDTLYSAVVPSQPAGRAMDSSVDALRSRMQIAGSVSDFPSTARWLEVREVPILEGAENTFIYARGHNEVGYHGFYGRTSFVVAL